MGSNRASIWVRFWARTCWSTALLRLAASEADLAVTLIWMIPVVRLFVALTRCARDVESQPTFAATQALSNTERLVAN